MGKNCWSIFTTYLLRAEACWIEGCHFQLIFSAENDSFVHGCEAQIE